MWKAQIDVSYKDGILEPQGVAIKDSLASLGFAGIEKVKVGKLIEIELSGNLTEDKAKEEVTAMCKKLLANVVMENFSFILKKVEK
ncbi:MAG: phosphoribosylformylglycinamidine synthase subunit PurS [Candidatus Margulisiibacteriota bacterium]|jgi:phosphoribosylformylglycinamidine synthase